MADYLSTTGEGKCIFCEIIEREMHTPGIFWEDHEFMAFLALYPNTEGFTVVVPKKHYGSDVLKMPDDALSRFVVVAKKVSMILLKHFDDVGRVGLIMEGAGIDHAHVKLSPMHGTAHFKNEGWKQHPSAVDTYFETYPGYIASNDGPKANEQQLKDLAEQLRRLS